MCQRQEEKEQVTSPLTSQLIHSLPDSSDELRRRISNKVSTHCNPTDSGDEPLPINRDSAPEGALIGRGASKECSERLVRCVCEYVCGKLGEKMKQNVIRKLLVPPFPLGPRLPLDVINSRTSIKSSFTHIRQTS